MAQKCKQVLNQETLIIQKMTFTIKEEVSFLKRHLQWTVPTGNAPKIWLTK